MNVLRRLPLLFALLSAAGSSHAAGINIGVVAPQDGNFATLGAEITTGANFAIQAQKDTATVVNEPCTEDGGRAAAEALVAAKAQVAIGFLCTETLEGALPRLKDAGIPVITVSVRSRILMEDALKNGWPLFRLAPVDAAEASMAIATILKNWASEPMALIDDGTIHGRELVGAIRSALEEKGLKPVFTDTYRPGQDQQIALVRRLKKAGATRVFVGGDRSDVAVIARDAKSENIPLVLMGGDAMRAADTPVPLLDGVQAIALPDYASLPAAQQTVQAMRAGGVEPDGYILPAAAAAQIASQAAESAKADNRPVADKLIGTTFQTAIGPISFGQNHELTENPYRLLEWRGNGFVPVATSSN
ncbi:MULTISPECIES: ABC transporter substrate-binding protein [unclassified Rhizobium]|jgi:branched-chain amino acid transport system substrate-binding protein|uniref:ABC transporter substrate-binding protein n=1 Tax=unclassified Rhizobium TaxID=2613769 RepID=UPI00064573DB|nr:MULTISPECIES: ABC transporter substrate-binding protein [unclassified Rhizobium]MBN8951656.1 ABC transporter substrate-binding protein [Rhizobium tropici]OJY67616.1 MAG: branched-chain amino acid ABC transporter substrate-binding protein [Rhizobium sp. 60-20]RKD60081.1 amino acid/amide ABC transporter substrate-binding protein (HAAT family) [Rhizobium sp. WW_1]